MLYINGCNSRYQHGHGQDIWARSWARSWARTWPWPRSCHELGQDHDQILAAIILAHGQDTCPRSLMILHKILPRFYPRFVAKNITLPKILGQELLAGAITSSCECSTYAPKTSRDKTLEILGFPKAVRFARQVLLLAVILLKMGKLWLCTRSNWSAPRLGHT